MRALKPPLRGVLTLASALAFALAFPPFAWHPLAWLALAPLFVALSGAGARAGAALAFVWALAVGFGIAGWLPGSVQTFFGASVALGWAAAFAVFAFAGCFLAVFGAWLGWASMRRTPHPLVIGAAWALVEWAREMFWIPNPWGVAAYSQAAWLPTIQIADLGGAPLVSFVIASVNASLAALVLRGGSLGARLRLAAPAVALLLVSLGYGAWRLAEPPAQGASFEVALIQPAIERERDWNPKYRDANLERYLALTAQAAARQPALVIWPEGAIDFSPRQDLVRRERLLEASRALSGDLLLGGPDRREAYGFAQEFNSTFLLRNGELVGIYDKVELMPFAEANPLRGFVGGLGRNLSAGREPHVLASAVGPLGVLLCSEVASTGAARERVRRGAQVLVNPASDRWFQVASAAEQHLQMAVFRAVETRRWLLRVSPNSTTAAIGPTGAVAALPSAGSPRVEHVQIAPPTSTSLDSRLGETWLAACLAAIWMGSVGFCAVWPRQPARDLQPAPYLFTSETPC